MRAQARGCRKTSQIVVLTLSCALLGWTNARAQAPLKPQSAQDQQIVPLIPSVEGADLFRAYCASCHGAHGKGDGPIAQSLRVAPPDLTMLAKNNRGQFPLDHVRRTILGDEVVAAHGTRDMPIWGPVFHQIETDVDRGNVRVQNLISYLESIQSIQPTRTLPSLAAQKAQASSASAETAASGAQLYKRFCASCHGNDLKGNGPAPPPFKDVPPDLTTLTKRHGGRFPDAYVTSVLRNGVAIPAHEPPEMPTWDADFRSGYGLNEAQVSARISALTNYLSSHQAK